MSKELNKNKIRAYVLENALKYGSAKLSAVIPRLFNEGLKKEKLKDFVPKINKIIIEVNSLSKEEKQKEFKELVELIHHRVERKGLPDLPLALKGKVVMRIAPYPSGPLHIGNAKIAILNDEFVKKYSGKLLLVIDDTIGSKEKQIIKEAYNLIPEGLKWLNVNFDKIYYKSDRLEIYYSFCEEILKKARAYVCECPAEELRKNRARGRECNCRQNSVSVNLGKWRAILAGKYKEGEAVVRIKTSMQHKNPAFRDRVLFRISSRKHVRVGKKYHVWPLLEFSWAIDDHMLGITHVLRGKELRIETEMEKKIFDIFRWRYPEFIHSGLLQTEDVKISKSKSQKEVKSGKYIGWDDPRTWSLQSLRRRGIKPEAIRKFILGFGLNETEIKIPIEVLYKENRKLIEKSKRFFFISNPKKIIIKNAKKIRVKIPSHPNYPKMGFREMTSGKNFYIQKSDKIKKGKIYRFMHLFNFKDNKVISVEYDPKLKAKMIHWLPISKKLIKTKILMPDGKTLSGFSEPDVSKLKLGEIVQFERFSFCRLDEIKKKVYNFWFSHK